jgi:hypothetical protein
MFKYIASAAEEGGNGRLCMTAGGVTKRFLASATFRHPITYHEHDQWYQILLCHASGSSSQYHLGLPDRPSHGVSEDWIGNTHGLAAKRNEKGITKQPHELFSEHSEPRQTILNNCGVKTQPST